MMLFGIEDTMNKEHIFGSGIGIFVGLVYVLKNLSIISMILALEVTLMVEV
jgi:hypothetical protein